MCLRFRIADFGLPTGRTAFPSHPTTQTLAPLHEPLSGDYVLEQHHPPAALDDCLHVSSMDRHSPPLIIDAPDLAYLFDSTHLASRISRPDRPPVSIELNLHPLWHVDRSESICFHNPQSAIRNPQLLLRFKVDQRVATLRIRRPMLYHVIEV